MFNRFNSFDRFNRFNRFKDSIDSIVSIDSIDSIDIIGQLKCLDSYTAKGVEIDVNHFCLLDSFRKLT